MSAALITATHLDYEIGGQRVLDDVNLTIAPGEIVTIVGPNGSGKTTLVRLLIGALRPTGGAIELRDGLRIGYVPQRLSIDHTLPITVDRFLALSERRASARMAALAQVGGEKLVKLQLIDLSGGQFQRVLLAQALLRNPELLVLDEAAQGLDQPGIAHFYRLIEEIRRELGCGVLMVSHDLHVVMSASDRVVCLNGHVCCEGTPLHVSNAPAYRALFGLGTEGALALYRHAHDHRHGGGAPGHHHHHADPGA
ncbi:ATP-binding cassette domain-containing protein [Amaricoccus macauensis]|uniref:ATP-binding cassette domain-containing protein n=1 Tax=Amaricoccus macauensis TaxID=57001 RepID=UPI003C7B2BD7